MMKWKFTLGNAGACSNFVRIQGVSGQTYLFQNRGGGGFTFLGEGTPEQFCKLAKDIYGVMVPRRHPIFFSLEIEDTTKLNAHIEGLEASNAHLIENLLQSDSQIAALEGEIAMLKPRQNGPYRTDPVTTNNPDMMAEEIDQPDVGLPVGPEVPDKQDVPMTPQQKRLATIAAKKAGISTPSKSKKRQPART
jgi:hypothetical protein